MSKKYNLIVKEEAGFDLRDAYEWHESKQSKLGDKFKRQLLKTLKSVQSNPVGFQKVFNNNRQAPVSKFPFLIVFEIFEKDVVVIAVFHTSRDPKKKVR